MLRKLLICSILGLFCGLALFFATASSVDAFNFSVQLAGSGNVNADMSSGIDDSDVDYAYQTFTSGVVIVSGSTTSSCGSGADYCRYRRRVIIRDAAGNVIHNTGWTAWGDISEGNNGWFAPGTNISLGVGIVLNSVPVGALTAQIEIERTRWDWVAGMSYPYGVSTNQGIVLDETIDITNIVPAPTPPPATPPPSIPTAAGACATNNTPPARFPPHGSNRSCGSCGCNNNSPGSCATCGRRCGWDCSGGPGSLRVCGSAGTCTRTYCDSEGNNCVTVTYTRYQRVAWTFCSDHMRDTFGGGNPYGGCEIPIPNITSFWRSPQYVENYTELSPAPQTCENTWRGGGCGGNNTCFNSSFGGGAPQYCQNVAIHHQPQSCRVARDGQFRCGGRAGCLPNATFGSATNPCLNDYVADRRWGTNEERVFAHPELPSLNTTSFAAQVIINALPHSPNASHQLPGEWVRFCELGPAGNNRNTALQVCNVTGTTSLGGHNIYCRCGQSDLCDLQNTQGNADLIATPADLRVVNLRLEESIGFANAITNPTPLINTPESHRLIVQFEVVPAGVLGISDSEWNKRVLYTRLIEVCPINILAATNNNWNDPLNWTVRGTDQCVIKRVDGNISLMQAPISIPIDLDSTIAQVINKDIMSQGPWTVRFRTINDVCNRTFGDYVVSSGQVRNCSGGSNCINVIQTSAVSGRMGGIVARGNAPADAYLTPGNLARQDYCSISGSASPAQGIIGTGRPNDYPVGATTPNAVFPVRSGFSGNAGGYPGVDHTMSNQQINEWID